jgi:hypothetical protein
MRMFVKPRILNQSKYTTKNKQSRLVSSIVRSSRDHIRLAKLRGSETAERPTHAAKNQKEFTPALLRSASGELLPSSQIPIMEVALLDKWIRGDLRFR